MTASPDETASDETVFTCPDCSRDLTDVNGVVTCTDCGYVPRQGSD